MEPILEDYVNVAVRAKPPKCDVGPHCVLISSDNHPVLCVTDRQQSYVFDNVFHTDCTQEEVYVKLAQPLVDHVLDGYNCTIFAYGQTGSGKTYTMGSDCEIYQESGIVTKTLDDLLNRRESTNDISISISFFEIYNEKVYDLLSPKTGALIVKNFKIPDLSKETVVDLKQVNQLLRTGCKNRHRGETKQNSNSSRSHAICTIYCNVRYPHKEVVAKLNLVDLAGSERARKTGCEGSQFHEGVNINKGLFNIGRVIKALSSNAGYIPYRESAITSILQDSLSKSNYITLVACISLEADDVEETVQTLEFAASTKKLKSKPEISNMIERYKRANIECGPALKARETPLKRPYNATSSTCPNLSKFRKLATVSTPMVPMVPLAESHETTIEHGESSCSLSLVRRSLESVAATTFSMSPVVRKCTETIETLMIKLDNNVNSYLRQTLGANKENAASPKISWNKLREEVSRLVKSEMMQISAPTTPLCSSSLLESASTSLTDSDSSSKSVVAKKLTFTDSDSDMSAFKVPDVPPAQTASKRRRKPSLNFHDSQATSRRRSVRLQEQQTKSEPVEMVAEGESGGRKSSKTMGHNRRKSVRIEAQQTPTKKIKSQAVDAHRKQIFDVLNAGDINKLKTLPMIGPKTAVQINVYRQLYGKFKSIADLKQSRIWGERQLQRFLQANLLHQ